jgi:hypothetical protein
MARCGRYKCFTLMFVNNFQQFVGFSVYYSYQINKTDFQKNWKIIKSGVKQQ